MRLSPVNPFNGMYDSDPQTTFEYVAEQLGRLGLAYLHVVEADEHGETTHPAVNFHRFRDAFGGTYIANGGFDYERAGAYLHQGRADLISFGRLFLANPDLPERFAHNTPLNVPDHATFYGGDETGYTDYPTVTGNLACCGE